jgi:hypothetical protein
LELEPQGALLFWWRLSWSRNRMQLQQFVGIVEGSLISDKPNLKDLFTFNNALRNAF